MHATATEHKNNKLSLPTRVVLVVAALGLGAFVVLGYMVAADLNHAYFGRRSVSLGAVDWVAAAGAVYCVLVGAKGRWWVL